MSKAVLDIQKGDEITFVEYNSKKYIYTSTHSPFTTDNPATFFDDSGSGVLVDVDSNPIQDATVSQVHLSSLVVDFSDIIFKTDGKLFNAIVD